MSTFQEQKRKYWKADGTYEVRLLTSKVYEGEYYQMLFTGLWRTLSNGWFIHVDQKDVPPAIQMALILLGEEE